MSMTLDSLWSIHGLVEQADFSQSTDVVARRRGGGFRFSFFYGPMWLFIFAALGGWYFQYRKKNPTKARKFEQGLRDASASAARRLQTATGDRKAGDGESQRNGVEYPTHNPAGNTANLQAHTPIRFNPPPNWPTPPQGWVPDDDWEPHPSWPPAPPGWQFWVA